MKFCTYNLCIVCYFCTYNLCIVCHFCTYNFAHFGVLYVQFWCFSHFVRTILPTFYEKYRPNLEVFKGKNGLKTVKNRYYLRFSKYFCTYKKCIFGVFLGYFSYFLPILWPKTHFYTPFFLYMSFTNIFVKSKYSENPLKKTGKWAESKIYTN